MIRVVIVEDHTLVRQSLVKMVAAQPGFSVVGEAGRAEEAIEVAERQKPDLLMLDVNIPGEDGLGVATRLKRSLPGVRVLFLTMHDDDATIRRAVALGADGYVPKTASSDELVQALTAVASGGSYLSPGIAKRVMDLVAGRTAGPASQLTDREMEILRLLSTGARASEVASSLYLSIKTVKNHLTSIYAKLGVETGAQAVAEAYRLGIVSQQQP